MTAIHQRDEMIAAFDVELLSRTADPPQQNQMDALRALLNYLACEIGPLLMPNNQYRRPKLTLVPRQKDQVA